MLFVYELKDCICAFVPSVVPKTECTRCSTADSSATAAVRVGSCPSASHR